MDAIATSGSGVSLRTALSRRQFVGGSDIRVRSVCHDWRACDSGDLFVALAGNHGDSHADVVKAVRRGAAAVLTEHLLPVAAPQCIVPDTREAYSHVCMALAGHPDESLLTVGITGTTGKTSTSLLLAAILNAAEQSASVLHDAELQIPADLYPASAPQPLIAAQLRRAAERGDRQVILEASSRALAQRQMAAVQLDMALLTNIRRDHLELHQTPGNYRNAKARILEQLKDDGMVIVNADDPYASRIGKQSMFPVLHFGLHHDAEVSASIIESCPSSQTFLLEVAGDIYPVTTDCIGEFHVSNCLAATAAALAMGIDLPTIVQGLESVRVVPRRLERIECGQPFSVYLDIAATSESLAASLKAISRVCHGRVWCVYGPAPDRHASQRPWLGRVAEQYADHAVITRCEHDASVPDEYFDEAHEVLDGYQRVSRGHVLPNRSAAIEWVLDQASPGDAVLIAGCADPLVYDPTTCGDDDFVRDLLYHNAQSCCGGSHKVFLMPPVSPN